jgi:hemoglobin
MTGENRSAAPRSLPAYPLGMQSLYDAAGGMDGLRRLARAWHTRVLADEDVSHAFSHGFRDDHVERLATYWAEALGGPPAYSERYGDESSVVRMHSGNGVHEEMDRRAIECFDRALEDAGLTAEPLRRELHDYFAWATTVSMARYPASADDVPAGLVLEQWPRATAVRGSQWDVPSEHDERDRLR